MMRFGSASSQHRAQGSRRRSGGCGKGNRVRPGRRSVLWCYMVPILLCVGVVSAAAQSAPAVFVLPAGDSVQIVLGDIPREVESFTVSRRTADENEYSPLTGAPVKPVADPLRARELMGRDYEWVARRVGSVNPQTVYRKLLVDRNLATAFSLVSTGVRDAMGLGISDSSVTRGERYRYRVSLLDFRGEVTGVVEEEVTAGAPEPPDAPRAVNVEAGDGEAVVEWDYPPYRGGADIAVGFLVYRSSGGRRIRVSEAPVLRIEDYLSFIDRDVENGRSYRYEVVTVSMAGAVSAPTRSEVVTPADSRAPLVPEDLTAAEQDENVLLLWRISPEPDVVGYNVFRSSRLNEEFRRINDEPVPVGEPRYLDTEVMGGDPYFYRVSAVDAAGNASPRSGVAVLVPADDTPPAALDGVELLVDHEARAVELRWQPARDSDLEGYFVYRGQNRDELVRLQATPLDPAEKPQFRDAGYEDRGLSPGVSLVYAVAAVDSSFNVGPKTFLETQIPDNVAPLPPYALSAGVTEAGEVTLRWSPRTVEDLAGHRVYRRRLGDGGDRRSGFEMIHAADREARSWTDGTVQRGRSYVYRLTHVDEAGNESGPSEDAEIVPTDVAPPPPPREVRAEEADRRGVVVVWMASAADDVAGYHIYREPYAGGPRRRLTAEPVEDTEYHDRAGRLSNNYSVSAVDTSGNEGRRQGQEREDG